MQTEAPPSYMVNGMTFLSDHEDRSHLYYQLLAPRFVTRRDGPLDVPQVLLVKYRSSTRSGGLFEFDVDLTPDTEQLEDARVQLKRLAGLPELPTLAPLPVVDGSVSLTLLGSGSGGVGGGPDGPGFVRSIRHSDKPALSGGNRVAFSVEVDERGLGILEQAMLGELSPAGIVFRLDYDVLRPAYHVGLTIDWDRTQKLLDQSFGHEGLFTNVQIQNVVEQLIEDRVIVLDTESFVPEGDPTVGGALERRDAAVARVKDMITDAFFEGSIDPLHEPPDGWDRAAEMIKSFAPQRFSPFGVFSYKQLDYTRIDSKRLDVDFTERITIRRSMYPQGHLAGLFRSIQQGVDRSKLMIDVSADLAFFERRRVTVTARTDFQQDPVRAITANLTYGGRTKTVALDADTPEGSVDWPSELGPQGQLLQPVDLSYEVELEPDDAGERPHRLVSEVTQVTGEHANIQPRDLFAEEDVPVLTLPGFPFDRYPQVDVQLRNDDPARGIRQDDLVRITKDSPSASWKRFLVGPPAGPVQAKLTYRAADQRDRELPFMALTRPQVDVADPFPQRLVVTVVPVLDTGTVDRAFVDLRFQDLRNHQLVETALELVPGQQSARFVVDRIDPTVSKVHYRVSVLMSDTTLFEGPWSTTLGQRIFVRADVRGHRAVTLRAPTDFDAQRLQRIEVQARASDELAGLQFEDRFDLTSASATAEFEFDFVDPARDAFELRVRRVFRNGLSVQGDWARFDSDTVTV